MTAPTINAIGLSNFCHSQLDWESRFFRRLWIPVFTGMTSLRDDADFGSDANLMALTSSINAEKRQWYERNRHQLAEFVTQLAFSAETQLDLSAQGLLPVASLTTTTHPLRVLETTLPVLRERLLQWHVTWDELPEIRQIFLKLGTGNRVNQCCLDLSVYREQTLVASARVSGTTIQDNQWTAFVFTQPIPAGEYLCQLTSPDADNAFNTLFLCKV